MLIAYMVDIHGNIRRVKNILEALNPLNPDYIVVGGDVTDFGSFDEALSILRFIRDESKKSVYFLPGNCDPPDLLKWEGEEGIYQLHEKVYSVGNFRIFGLGGSLTTPFNTNIEFSESEIEEILSRYSEEENLLFVTHSPPHGTKLDKAMKIKHVGSKSIRRFIEERKPILVLTGHIHESSGVDNLGNSIMVNPGPASRGKYAIIKLGEEKVLEAKIHSI